MKSKNRTFLNDAAVRKLSAPASGYTILFDTEISGYGARVTANGVKAFVLRYRTRGGGRERSITIGRYPAWAAAQARVKARELRRAIDEGADPLGGFEQERAAPSVNDLADRFTKEHLPRLRPGSIRGYRTILEKYIRPTFGRMKLADVRYADVERLHRAVTAAGGPYAGNRTVAVFASMCSRAVRWGWLVTSPARNVERNSEISRKRHLVGDELARLVKALTNYRNQDAADIVRVLLLSGCKSVRRWGCAGAILTLLPVSGANRQLR